MDPQGCPWRSPYSTHNNFDYIQIGFVKSNPLKKNWLQIVLVSLKNQLVHQRFGPALLARLRHMEKRELIKGPPEDLPK